MATNNMKTTVEDNNQLDIDLLECLSYLREHFLILLIVMAVGAVIAFSVTKFFIKPLYKASASLYIVAADDDSSLGLSDLNFGTSLANDYVRLVKSRTMLNRVIENSGENLTPEELQKMLSVGNDASTRILTITVTSPNAVQAAKLANSFLDQAVIFLPEVMGLKDKRPTEIDTAIVPKSPSNQNYLRNLVLGAAGGLLVALIILVIRFIADDALNCSEDVEKYIGYVPIAVVPENGQKHRGDRYYYSNKRKQG